MENGQSSEQCPQEIEREREREREREGESTLLLFSPRPSVRRASVRPFVSDSGIDWRESREEGKNPIGNSVHPSPSQPVRPSACLSVRPSVRHSVLRTGKERVECRKDDGRGRSVGRLTLAGSRPLSLPAAAGQVVGSGEPRRLGPAKDNRRTHACESFPATRRTGQLVEVVLILVFNVF